MGEPSLTNIRREAMGEGNATVLKRLWRVKILRLFWLAITFSNLGKSAFLMAISWLTVRLYGAHGIALLSLVYGFPQLLFPLFGGVATDRLARRRLYGLTESLLLLIAALLWLSSISGNLPLWLLLGVSLGNGVISAFDVPARSALISEMVLQEDLVSAQQVFNISAQVAGVFGPALGGVLLSIGAHGHSNEGLAFLFYCFSYIPVLLCLPFLPKAVPAGPSQPQRLHMQDVVRGVRQGFVYVGSSRSLVVLMQLLAAVMLLGGPFQSLLPIYVHDSPTLAADHRAYAVLLSAVALGGFVGALLGVPSAERRYRYQAVAHASLGLGCALLLLTSSQGIHGAVLSAFLAGGFSIFAINLDTSLLLGLTPAQIQGRVSSIASLGKGLHAVTAAAASEAIGQLSHSPLKNHAYSLIQGGLAVALIIFTMRVWRSLGQLEGVQARSPAPESLGG
jgi:MFS family permease